MADAPVLGAGTFGVWVQVPSPAPNNRRTLLGCGGYFLYRKGLERRLLATIRWIVATAVAFSAEKASPIGGQGCTPFGVW